MSSLAIGISKPDVPRIDHAGAVVAAALGCSVLYLFNPADEGLYPLCPFRVMTGLYCPGCGTLRAGNRLLHGRVGDAFGLNPLTILFVPVLLYFFTSSALVASGRDPLPRLRLNTAWIWALCVVFLAFGVLRNIPVYPLTLLSP